MRKEHAAELACPECAGSLAWERVASCLDGEVEEGEISCSGCSRKWPVTRHLPRFVPAENYSDSFTLQWHTHARIQLDSYNGTTNTRDRLFSETRWDPKTLVGARVLECGSGAGRFTEVLLKAGARVCSFDYSGAVDANWANNGPNPNLTLAQGDICRIPFRKGTFDKVLCFGVLQHTPDPRQAFMSMAPYLKPGGEIVVDVYPKGMRELLHWKYVLRPITKRMDKRKLYALVRRVVPALLPVSLFLGRIPPLGKQLFQLVPVNNPEMGVDGLSPQDLREWSILDTYDWYAPAYDQPQTLSALRNWFEEAKLENVAFDRMGVHVGRGRRPRLDAS